MILVMHPHTHGPAIYTAGGHINVSRQKQYPPGTHRPKGRGGATVLKVGGAILRAERAKNFLTTPLFGQWGGQNIA